MSDARFRVRRCGPSVSIQDAGRFGMARFGVSASGPMDRLAHAAACAALGRGPQAAIEVSMAGIELQCESGEVGCGVAGGDFAVRHNGAPIPAWCVRTLREGDTLSLRPGPSGSWAYLAFAGTLDVRAWAGSVATHVPSGLGGQVLRADSTIVVRGAQVAAQREGEIPRPAATRDASAPRVVLGPQHEHFEPSSLAALVRGPFRLTPAGDRMGVRLDGPALRPRGAMSIPSEPIVRGSVQVAGDGVASVLLADHQTTGGYPKIASLLSCDVDGFAQLRPGAAVSFVPVEADEAIRLVREDALARAAYLAAVAVPRGTLLERLMRENLISGVLDAAEASGPACGRPTGEPA